MNATTPTESTNPRPKTPPLIEKFDRFVLAWNTFAPESVFGGKTLSQFTVAVAPSKAARAALAELDTTIKGTINLRNKADATATAMITTVVAGVIADPMFGINSSLYRAMGYVPRSERKAPSATPAASIKPAPAPGMIARLDKLISAWGEIAPEVLFGNHTRAEFEAAVEPCRTTRATLVTAKTNRSANVGLKHTADATTKQTLKRIVDAVRGDAKFGDDCALYRAMGYVPGSERRSPKRTPVAVPSSATQA